MGSQNIKTPKSASAAVIMADGGVFFGKSIGCNSFKTGEICFNTSLTGYQEILTDPSYAGQIITFTFPHIGNVGVNSEDNEAVKPFAHGLIIREDITNPSNYRSENHLDKWLKEKKITGICGVDTRAITRHIRINGPQNVGIIHFAPGEVPDFQQARRRVEACPPLKGLELASKVSCAAPYKWNETLWQNGVGYGKAEKGKFRVVAIDYGMKLNILRCLADAGCDVHVVPAKTAAEDIIKMKPNGVFLSNGPGDPAATAEYAVPVIQAILAKNIPVFGICLGHQLLARALGCATSKMHLGHRGANQPVQRGDDKRVEITSQNHGFVVSKLALPDDVEVTHLSLFDDTIEGVRSKTKPAFAVQHHPEASPGPHDSFYLFDRFVEMMRGRRV